MKNLDAANAARAAKAPDVHLYRGAPAVRSWSRHQETVTDWTLCGIKRGSAKSSRGAGPNCTEVASEVSCTFCLSLMRPSQKRGA